MKQQPLWAPMACLMVLSTVSLWAQSNARTVSLNADTVLKVKMDDTIGSDRSKKGDKFRAIVDDRELPEGTEVIGFVTDVKKASGGEGGKLAMEFRLLELPDGRRVKIVGVPSSLDSKSVKTTSDGRMVATQSGKKNSGKYLAIGAGGGLLIGSMLGSNVAGALIGGAAGYFMGKDKDKKSKNKEVVLKEGTEIGVRLDQRVAVNTSQVRPASNRG